MARDHHFFEKWAREQNMKPVMKVEEKAGDILVADSGEPFYGANQDGILGSWYRTGYAISRGEKTWLANFAEYDADEFGDLSRREGQEKRVNECLVAARVIMSETETAGLYDA